MINRDQISNLRKLFLENQNPDPKKNSVDVQNSGETRVYGQVKGLNERVTSAAAAAGGEAQKAVAAKTVRSIAVSSGKGGVGKSNFVANLAISLSKLGKKVLILDADLGLANIDVIFGIRPKYNLFHVITGQKKITDIIVGGPENVLLVPGGSGIVELANINESERRHFIAEMNEFESGVDIILIDTSAGINKNVLCFLKACSEVIFITVPEPPAMADAYGIIKAVVTVEKIIDQSMSLVVNRVSGEVEARDVYDRLSTVCRRFLNVKLNNGGYVLEDRAVPLSVRAQKPFISENPRSGASQCIENISKKLLNMRPENNFDQNALGRIKNGVTSFFCRIGELFN